ncbi:DNA mismatch repair endonuclease MutL [Catenovulum maritimum]|uniref:DNA mismatch repair endonuclease MutL n=1 Tax=Catenovulum maritimum TaxID=1513271 RepID=UPI0006615278|nr:DNA mismatch repair endonuclease MutL [Catenovulum maritimum]
MPIQILPPQLANQIAAGEVVERPASVVKELLENSLDAGATKIEIDIERGGSQLIRIRDNGKGIVKEELGLALSRHATSKVSTLDDLESINSLGFRGEALASISSVSRLTLTSKTAEQEQAWSAIAEGREMDVTIQPAAHPNGTCIEVADLFFNTPARRRFLRTDKTEFQHIEEVVRRIALSRFDLQLKLTHNGQTHRQYRCGSNANAQNQRIAAICGKNFAENTIEINAEYEGVSLSGWLGLPAAARNQNDIQYSYINGRMIRDKLINHAIRQAFNGKISNDLYPSYVVYISIDPRQIDVNVHPSKHEVRFHQSRIVHDFVLQSIERNLTQYLETQALSNIENHVEYTSNIHFSEAKTENQEALNSDKTVDLTTGEYKATNQYQVAEQAKPTLTGNHRGLFPGQQKPSQFERQIKSQNTRSQIESYAELVKPIHTLSQNVEKLASPQRAKAELVDNWQALSVLKQSLVIFSSDENLYTVKLASFYSRYLATKFVAQQQSIVSQPLLLPVAIKITPAQLTAAEQFQYLISDMGFQFNLSRKENLIVQKTPAILREIDIASFVNDWLIKISELNLEQIPANTWLQNPICLAVFELAAKYSNISLAKLEQVCCDWQVLDQAEYQQYLTSKAKLIDLTTHLESN